MGRYPGFFWIATAVVLVFIGIGFAVRHTVGCDERWLASPFVPCSEELQREVEGMYRQILLGVYCTLLALVVFFLCENAPWHRSQAAEQAYLSVIFAIIFSADFLDLMNPRTSRTREAIWIFQRFFGIVIAWIVIHAVHSMTAPRQLPGFFDKRLDKSSPFFEQRRPLCSIDGARLVAEVKTLQAQIISYNSGTRWFSDEVFVLVVLVLITLLKLFATYGFKYIRLALASRMLVFLWTCTFGSLIYIEWKRRKVVKPLVQKLCWIVRQLASKDEGEQSPALLRHLLWSVSVATLMEIGKADIYRLLQDRSHHFGPVEKAIIIDAISKRQVRNRCDRQEEIQRLICSCTGPDIHLLKSLLDSSGTYYTLHKLMYVDITDKDIRHEIEHHLAVQGEEARFRNGGCVGIKVLSDVDDTLMSSGGKFPAGVDKSYPHHAVYPGCLELFRSLDTQHATGEPSCNMVFLSARPHFYKDVTEERSYRLFTSLVEERRMHSMPALLPGELIRGATAMLTFVCRKTQAWRSVGRFKYRAFRKYARLYPEFDFVFFGDNGQGDLLCGQMMLSDADEVSDSEESSLEQELSLDAAPRVRAVLVHDVLPDDEVLSKVPDECQNPGWRRKWQQKHLYFHKTSVGAAVDLFTSGLGLVSADQLRKVATAAMQDYEYDVKQSDVKRFDWDEVDDALRRDLERANTLVCAAGLPPLDALASLDELVAGCRQTMLAEDNNSWDNVDEPTSEGEEGNGAGAQEARRGFL